jgi:hypothetical protein
LFDAPVFFSSFLGRPIINSDERPTAIGSDKSVKYSERAVWKPEPDDRFAAGILGCGSDRDHKSLFLCLRLRREDAVPISWIAGRNCIEGTDKPPAEQVVFFVRSEQI